ncbi:hypothetical protein [Kitasatospora sp. NPDC058218]|uniref:hypothetical protein n=1 Tax=Kitasatospora sp. NPDC058218 TaxID=3346385 RepID=UPI0036DCD053
MDDLRLIYGAAAPQVTSATLITSSGPVQLDLKRPSEDRGQRSYFAYAAAPGEMREIQAFDESGARIYTNQDQFSEIATR